MKNRQVLLVYIFLTVAVLITFRQVNRFDFISYDDPVYVTENTHILHGMTMEAVRWAFAAGYAANWHPLTWMSHMLDIQLFGLNPRWHHLTNLLFHIANTLLLFFVFNRMTKEVWKSAFVAALFALHPLHVESVAWVAERKDVLSTFFWMLTMAAYIHYVDHRRLLNYVPVVILFALGLMAKPMLVTLPFVLLLMDYWPLQRLQEAASMKQEAMSKSQNPGRELKPLSSNKEKTKSGRKSARQTPSASTVHRPQSSAARTTLSNHTAKLKLSAGPEVLSPQSFSLLLLEKLPLFVLTALSCIVTYVVQQKGGAVSSTVAFPLGVRIANALVSYIIYIEKTVWPHNLAVFYPHPGLRPLWQVFGSALALIAVTFIVIRSARRHPCLAVGWLWFTGTLVPVIGIVQAGSQAMADRYSYIPLIGLFVMAAWGIPELVKKRRYHEVALFASSAIVLICLFSLTWTQLEYWNDSISLYNHSLSVTGYNDTILNNRGVAYSQLGNPDRAVSDYDKAIEINPGNVEVYNNRGIAQGKLGNHRRAIEDFDRAIEIDPGHAEAYFNRCVARSKLGSYRQAIQDCSRAIEIDPAHAEAYFNRGVAYGELGNHQQAIEDFDRAVGINPEDAKAYFNRAVAFGELGNRSQAIDDMKTAARLGHDSAKNFLRGEGIRW